MTLTELSYYSRRLLPFVIIFLLIILIVYYIFKLFFIYLNLNRSTPLYTNTVFGKIKRPQLEKPASAGSINYIFDTVEGQPISASGSARVFFIPDSTTKFGYREKIYLMAKNLGFDTSAVKYKLSGKNASFSDGKRELNIDITNFNFSYQYQFNSSDEFFSNNFIPKKEEIENRAIDFLKRLDRYPKELALGKTSLIYLKYDPTTNSLSIVNNSNLANMVEIDFYRPDIDIFPIVSPSYYNSQNLLVMTFFGEDMKVLKAQIKFFEKSDEQYGVYPTKTGEQAFTELKNGNSLIVSMPKEGNQVTIKQMFFAYFDPDVYQPYLQPVYVFLGDNNFVGYVPAISNDYLVE